MEERQLLSTWPQFQLAPTGSASTASDIAAVSRIPGSMDNTGPTDLLSYNAATGRAAFSIGTGTAGDQKVVRDVVAAQGWTSIVPMNIDNDVNGLTDLLSNPAAATGYSPAPANAPLFNNGGPS